MILIIPYMAWTSRMAGGGWPKLPWGLDQWLYALPILLFWPLIGYWAIPAYITLAITKRMGTRQYLDGGTWTGTIRKPNNIDFLISWLKESVNPKTYDFIGNTLLGLIQVIIASIILMAHGLEGYALLFGGAMRGFAHAIGWGSDVKEGSIYGEILSGAFVGYGVWLCL